MIVQIIDIMNMNINYCIILCLLFIYFPTSVFPTNPNTTQPPATTTAAASGVKKSSDDGLNIGIIIGVLLLVIIIGAVLFCIYQSSPEEFQLPESIPMEARAEQRLFLVNNKGDPIIRLHVDHPLYRL